MALFQISVVNVNLPDVYSEVIFTDRAIYVATIDQELIFFAKQQAGMILQETIQGVLLGITKPHFDVGSITNYIEGFCQELHNRLQGIVNRRNSKEYIQRRLIYHNLRHENPSRETLNTLLGLIVVIQIDAQFNGMGQNIHLQDLVDVLGGMVDQQNNYAEKLWK